MRYRQAIGFTGVISALLGLIAAGLQFFGWGVFNLSLHATTGSYVFFGTLTLLLLGIAFSSIVQGVYGANLSMFILLALCTVIMPFFSVFAYLNTGFWYIPSFLFAIVAVTLAGTQCMRISRARATA